ncbi:hypothetical protein C6I20_05345 [Aeromicrobium sp. A1-2]|uniref:hypothetical protein n=1 Tax=Aeromicrobium sp. A1-2 TaxID=2107713 RepID=UPI000E49837C|nr:hypothetical protein [Aeromicrobium sp. A1-2]AXT84672.1 hypothetical protein C6I20_05345 [Aeromicrobium sp. A1-2]
MNIDLNSPIWTIDHVATVLLLSVDRAREHTYGTTFPKPKAGFSSNLWLRDEVLAWFSALPVADRSRPSRRKNPTARPTPSPIRAADTKVKASTYKPRTKRAVTA